MNYAQTAQEYLARLSDVLKQLNLKEIEVFTGLLEEARANRRQVIVFGNGGSAATASHMLADLNKGVSYGNARKFRAVCLNDNIATMMAYANDVSYECIFIEQLKNVMNEGDLVIGISGSGNSPNVLRAIEWANENGGVTMGLCGYNGGKLKQIARHSVHADVQDMQMSEDVHLILGHIAMQALCTVR